MYRGLVAALRRELTVLSRTAGECRGDSSSKGEFARCEERRVLLEREGHVTKEEVIPPTQLAADRVTEFTQCGAEARCDRRQRRTQCDRLRLLPFVQQEAAELFKGNYCRISRCSANFDGAEWEAKLGCLLRVLTLGDQLHHEEVRRVSKDEDSAARGELRPQSDVDGDGVRAAPLQRCVSKVVAAAIPLGVVEGLLHCWEHCSTVSYRSAVEHEWAEPCHLASAVIQRRPHVAKWFPEEVPPSALRAAAQPMLSVRFLLRALLER
eukprot:2348265-Prymnesium_polylepis.2